MSEAYQKDISLKTYIRRHNDIKLMSYLDVPQTSKRYQKDISQGYHFDILRLWCQYDISERHHFDIFEISPGRLEFYLCTNIPLRWLKLTKVQICLGLTFSSRANFHNKRILTGPPEGATMKLSSLHVVLMIIKFQNLCNSTNSYW